MRAPGATFQTVASAVIWDGQVRQETQQSVNGSQVKSQQEPGGPRGPGMEQARCRKRCAATVMAPAPTQLLMNPWDVTDTHSLCTSPPQRSLSSLSELVSVPWADIGVV